MKRLFIDKSSKYRIARVALPLILGFIAMGSLGAPFSFASSHTPNFCDSYQGSVQGLSNFRTTCHQLVDSLSQDKKTLLQDPTFVKRLQAYLKNSTTLTSPTSPAGSYIDATTLPSSTSPAGRHILVQLLDHVGNMIPCHGTDPFAVWTLYGDGMLIFANKGEYCGPLLQAQLTLPQVNSILNFIMNQNSFFATSQVSYGQPVPDIGSRELFVSTNGQQKTVTLYTLMDLQATPDAQTQHVFAIQDYLDNYHPANALPYVSTGGNP